jgi:antitoxin (DNA-binding transcriptional repressor) of toxin-antitoxin stability system
MWPPAGRNEKPERTWLTTAETLPEYGRRKRGETWVLTRRGRPVAAVVPIDDENYFSIRLANDPRFIALIERSRASFKATGGSSLAKMRRRYGIPAKPRSRSASRKRR